MSRVFSFLLLALVGGCAGGAGGPPAERPGATPPAPPPAAPGDRPAEAEVPPEGAEAADPEAEAVGVRRLGRWSQSGIESPERLVVRDSAALSAVWNRLGVGDQPQVDFARELVVVASAGQKPTGGHTISVSRAVLWEGTLVIEVLEMAPAPDCVTTQALTYPVDVVAMPSEGVERWQFSTREEVGGCGG